MEDLDGADRPSEANEILKIASRTLRKAVRRIIFWFGSLNRQQKALFAIVPVTIIGCIFAFNLVRSFSFTWPHAAAPTLFVATATATAAPIRETPSATPFATISPKPTATATEVPLPTPTPFLVGCVNVGQLRIRSGPGTSSSLIGGIVFGDCIELIYQAEGENGPWAGFTFEGQIGWVSAEFLDFEGGVEELAELPLGP